MSLISDIVHDTILEYNRAKIGDVSGRKEPPPSNVFSLSEVLGIGRDIVRRIEGKLADKYLQEDS